MGLLDRLRQYLGDDDSRRQGGTARTGGAGAPRGGRSEDEVAVDRYRYLLRTAPPDAVEEVHAEAFAALTPDQRKLLFDELSRSASTTDRPASDDPRALARSATRSEMRQPGFLERTLGPGGGGGFGASRGPGLGTMIGGSLLGTVAGVVIGSAIADTLLPGIGDMNADFAGDAGADAGGADGSDAGGSDAGTDGGGDFGGGYDGGGFGDGGFGGGGDFGGGDFGGGDF